MTNMRPLSSLLIAIAALTGASASARADETTGAPPVASSSSGFFAPTAGPFGELHQWVYSMTSEGEFPFRLTKTGSDDWRLVLRPSADTFIVRNVSVGGIVILATDGGGTTVGVGVRAGYNLVINSLVSFWVRGGITYTHFSPNMGSGSNSTFFNATAPFLFHLVPHFFVGVGPMFDLPLQQTGGTGSATFGLTAIVGGWL